MDITELRKQIDSIDDELIELFHRRMDVSRDIAAYKKSIGMRVYDPAREREKLYEIAMKSGEDMGEYSTILWNILMDLSKTYQERVNAHESPLSQKILHAMENTLSSVKGRHDPCIVPRALPCMEAAMALALYDAILERENGGK